VTPWSPQQLILGLIRWVQRRGDRGYLCLDDVMVEKTLLQAAGLGRVDLLAQPEAPRVWLSCRFALLVHRTPADPGGFPTLAAQARRHGTLPYQAETRAGRGFQVVRAGLEFEYLTFDLWYNARWFVKWLDQQKIIWGSTLKSNARITYRGRTQPVAVWAQQLPRHRIAGHIWAWVGTVYLPQYGSVRLVVATNGMGDLDYIVSNDLHRREKVLVYRKRSRWDIEMCFRDTKQLAGLAACQCRVAQAMERHVGVDPAHLSGVAAGASRPIRHGG